MANSSPLKWHGGKAYLSPKYWDIVMASSWHPIHVVELYCGSAAFTLEGLARNYPFSFAINDIDKTLMNFWDVLRDENSFLLFKRLCEATPFSEPLWHEAKGESNIEKAWAFFVKCRQSLAGRMKNFTGVTRTRTRRNMNAEVSAWLNIVEGLADFHALVKKILIFCRPALDLIKSEDGKNTLFMCDPPYLHETRATTGEYGENEMTEQDHIELLEALSKIKGKFLLCGYESDLYNKYYKTNGWVRHDFAIANSAAGGLKKRVMTECLWSDLTS